MFDRIKAFFSYKSMIQTAVKQAVESTIVSERKKVSKKINRVIRKKLQAHYDSATTSDENRRHWKEARENTPTSVNNRDTRRRLRIRARYEHDNNCYAAGVVSTYSKDVIGSVAPKLQLQTGNREFDSFVENEWNNWSNSEPVNLTFKLKLLDTTKLVEGEGFLLLRADEHAKRKTGYSLNPEVLGPSRITDPYSLEGWFMDMEGSKVYNDDGVLIDLKTGRPLGYMVSDVSSEVKGNVAVTDRGHFISSKYLLQWFTPTRPHQYRGVCEIQAALNLFAYIRRYSLATVTAAEFAAMLAGVMKTNQPVGDGPAIVKDYTSIELLRGALISLPEGWEAQQFEPKQPISTFESFVNTLLREIGRLLDMPRGVVLGDSSAYNYSSARMDYQGYDDRIAFLRSQLNIRILDGGLFPEWYNEFIYTNLSNPDPDIVALIRSNIAYDENGQPFIPKHTWQFTKRQSIDPQKDATAATERLKNLTSNLAIECAANGEDWEELLKTYSSIIQRIQELGLTNVFASGIMGNAGASVSTDPASTQNPINPDNPPNNTGVSSNGHSRVKV